MAYRLEPHESLAAGLRRIVVEQAEAAAEHLATAEDPAPAVHEARKRGKEARAALRLLRGSLGDEAAGRARAALRDAARRIAAARDAEVALATLARLRQAQRLLRRERIPAEQALRAQRDAAAAGITAELRRAVAAAFEAASAELPGIPVASTPTVADGLARIYRRGRRAMRAATETGDDEDYHRWRQGTKDLWYAVRLFQGAWPAPLGALAEELHALSQLLGEEHDLTVLRANLAISEQALLTPRLERAIERFQRRLRRQAQPAGQRLWAESPRAFASRVLGYWESWRKSAAGAA